MKDIFYVAALVLIMIIYLNLNIIKGKQDKMKERMGQKIILENDTLTIINYSLFEGDFTLSNGVKIDYNMAIKLDSIKKHYDVQH